MKTKKYRIIALALVLCLIASQIPVLANSIVPGIGEVATNSITVLSDSATLTQNTVSHVTAGQQSERYIEWRQGGQIKPIVAVGDTVYGGALTLDEATEKMNALGYDVAAGMNGDYFTLATGIPLGLTVVNGEIIVSDGGFPAVGFYGDGQAFISRPNLKTSMTFGNKSYNVEYINKMRGSSGLYLYTDKFGMDTKTTTHGVNVILQTNDKLSVGGTIYANVLQITAGTEPAKLGEGMICLSAESAEASARLSDLREGVTVAISTFVNDVRYMNCENIIGGYRMLLENSMVVCAEQTLTRAPRTAVGIRADGTVVYYGVDGRQGSYSAGLGLVELAERMLSLGCVVAVELDGGGSTDMTARFPGDYELTRLGRPSDGRPRKVANHILFVNNAPKTGIVNQIYVQTGRVAALTGAEIPFSDIRTTAIDTNYHPMEAPSQLSFSSSNEQVARVSNNRLAAVAPGKTTVSVMASHGARGSFEFEVADKPDGIAVYDAMTNTRLTEISLAPYEQLRLKAVGLINGVEAPGGIFYWMTADNAATVDNNGVLTAGGVNGSSTRLVVGMGETLATINVTVGKAPEMIEDFEGLTAAFKSNMVGTGYTRNADKQHVKYGYYSGEFLYDFTAAPEGTMWLMYDADIQTDGKPGYLSMWVKGDGSGNSLNVVMLDEHGQQTEMTVAALNFTDYRHFSVPMVGVNKIIGLKLIRSPGGAASGTFYIDQMLSVPTDLGSTAAPAINLALEADGTNLNVIGSAYDFGGAVLRKDDISISLNGAALSFNYNESTGAVTASAPLPMEGVHIVTLKAANRYGNYDMITKEFEQPTVYSSNSYNDISDHWAGKYIELLYRNDVLPGGGSFRPADIVTRAEVAVMMSGALGLNEELWSNVTLPYEDINEIPTWAMSAVKALYGEGYMRGVGLSDGRRAFQPSSGFTRAEMFGIIGNAIPKGIFKNSDALRFEDYASVPSYASGYVDMLIGIGVVTGMDGRLNPQDTVTRAQFATILARIR
ncbi:MAG: phosphodiester glycosidase family protein [Oscillospiraceae bacterium]|nr:phosphodiester glycosidase family protein [Oscillospiraceae bacterium]